MGGREININDEFGAMRSKQKDINVKECLTSRRGVSVADATFSQRLVLLLDLHNLLALGREFFLNLVKTIQHAQNVSTHYKVSMTISIVC